MQRRTVIRTLAATAATAAVSACTATRAPSAQPTARPAPRGSNGPGAGSTAPAQTFSVRTHKLTLARGQNRPLPTSVWRPTTGGPYPLILFSHGLQAVPQDYAQLLSAWARAGFVVAAPSYPFTARTAPEFNPVDVLNQPLDAAHVITQLVERGGVDAQWIAAAGHSAGGVTTLGMFAGRRDTRLRAGLILAGRQIIATPLAGPAVPLLFVHGRRDRTVPYADGRAVFDAVTWPKAFLTFPDGGHVAEGAQLKVVTAASTDFWRWTRYGDQPAKARIPYDATRGGLATLTNHL